MEKRVKWGVLGCAGIARTRTLPGLMLADNAELYAVAVYCPDNYKLEIEQFGRCVRGLETPEVTKEETIGNAAILDLAMADAERS